MAERQVWEKRLGGTDQTDLTRFRDHARERADWQPGPPKAACRDRPVFGTPKPADHTNCGGGRCGCACHAPTDAERELWELLAGEIDRHLVNVTGRPQIWNRDDTPLDSLDAPDATLEGPA